MYSAGILPDLPYDIVDEILTKMKRLEIEPVLNELMWYVKNKNKKMTYIYKQCDNNKLIIEFNNKYNTFNLSTNGEYQLSTNGEYQTNSYYSTKHVIEYQSENFTCYAFRHHIVFFKKNELRDLIKSVFPTYNEQIEKLKMKAFSKMTKKELKNLYLKLE